MKNTRALLCIFLLIIGGMACQSEQSSSEGSGKEITLRLNPTPDNPRNSEGDFIQLNDGRILFVYTHFTGGTGDHANAYLAGRYSSDGGRSWTQEDELILSNEGGMNIMSVSLLRLKNGEIVLFYLRKNSESDCIPYMRTSTDEAATWSEAIRCIDTVGYHVVNNDRFVQLQNGRIIFPTALHSFNQSRLDAHGQILCYYSDDNGLSWNKSMRIANAQNVVLQEPGVVALNNGNLMLFCRTNAGVQYVSFSEDHGNTWSPVAPGNIKSPLSPASIKRIPTTGDLLLVWNNNYNTGQDGGKRTPFNLAISQDEGLTWIKTKSIESDPAGWYCYTAIDFVDDHVLLGHCAGDRRTTNGLATTHITRLSLDWVYMDATADPVVASDRDGMITLSCSDKNTQIRYTLDGSLPLENSGIRYEDPIEVSRITPLYMQAFQSGKTPSQIVSKRIGSDVYQEAIQSSDELSPGLVYKYYENECSVTEDIQGTPVLEEGVTSELSIEKNRGVDHFAFVFDGYINIPADGAYTFYLESNDGSVMYVDDFLLINNDGQHGANEEFTSISLRSGMHKIVVRYFQAGGGQAFNVRWEGPKFSKQEIDAKYLFHRAED